MKLEMKFGEDQAWTDLTEYVGPGGEHAMTLRPTGRTRARARGTRLQRKTLERVSAGPNRRQRALAYRIRAEQLPQRLEITGGTGNWMVNLCRSGTAQAERDKATWQRGGDGQTASKHPNKRLRHYGLKVVLDARASGGFRVIGGTARQRACYLRAVDHYMGHGDPVGEAL